jgi:hypothetical protein
MDEVIDGALDRKEIERLLQERSLAGQTLGIEEVEKIREDMERIEARRLQPHYIREFFEAALSKYKGQMRKQAHGRFSIPNVPKSVVDTRDSFGRRYAISKSYEAITFAKEHVRVTGIPDATLICPGHPLLSALIDKILDDNKNALKEGTVFIDNNADTTKINRLLFYIEDTVYDGRKDTRTGGSTKTSTNIHFVEIYPDRHAENAGLSPYLDYAVPTEDELPVLKTLLAANSWWNKSKITSPEQIAQNYAISKLCPDHLHEVEERRHDYVDKVSTEVEKRLSKEIDYQDAQAGIFFEQAAQGKPNAASNAARAQDRARTLEKRKTDRLQELALERNVFSGRPAIIGGAWIVPRAMLDAASMSAATGHTQSAQQATEQTKTEIELAGMSAVMEIERGLGNIPKDVSKENRGYDIESHTPDSHLRFIEVKGRNAAADFVTLSHNEIQSAVNTPGNSILAIVQVDGDNRKITYCSHWAAQPPAFAVDSANFDLKRLFKSSVIELQRSL